MKDGSKHEDFDVITLSKSEGWAVSSHGVGMYTFIHADEIAHKRPDDAEISAYGKLKRDKDWANAEIIHVNRRK